MSLNWVSVFTWPLHNNPDLFERAFEKSKKRYLNELLSRAEPTGEYKNRFMVTGFDGTLSKLSPSQRTKLMKAICITLALFCCINGCTLLNLTVKQRQSLLCEFEYDGEGKSVCISGDFNHWSTDTHCMDRNNDRWTIGLNLRPGVYRYLFWVDGVRWVVDPKALFVENDGYGMQNGVAIID